MDVRARSWMIASLLSVGLLGIAACTQAAAPTAPTVAATSAAKPAATTAPATGTAAATAAPKAARVPTGTVKVGRGGSTLRVFDPGQVNSSEGGSFMYPAFDGLGWLDSNGEFKPALATSWKNTDDLTWEFVLGDWTFHNGRKVTVEDIVGTYQRVQSDPRLIGNASFADVASYSKLNETTLQVKTKKPYPVLPKILSLLAIIPVKEFNEMGGIDAFSQRPIGSGPFKVTKADFNNSIDYEAMGENFKSVRGVPYIKNFSQVFILEEGSREAALRSGAVQVAALNDDNAARLGAEGYNVPRTSGSATTHVNLDTFTAPFNNVKVRQAMNHAVDKQRILDTLYRGNGVPDGQMSGAGVLGYSADTKAYPYDVVKARALLAEAGFANGIRTTIITVPTIASIGNEVAEVLQQYFRAVGVDAAITPKDNAAWVGSYNTGPETRPGMMMQVFNFEQTYEVDGAWRWFTSDFTVPGGRRWVNEDFDRLYQQGKSTFDTNRRGQLYQQAGRILNDQAPVIYLYQRFAPVVFAKEWTADKPGFADYTVSQIRPK